QRRRTVVRLHDAGPVIAIAECEHAPVGRGVFAVLSSNRTVEDVNLEFVPAVDLKDTFGRPGRDRRDIQPRRVEHVLRAVMTAVAGMLTSAGTANSTCQSNVFFVSVRPNRRSEPE